MADPRAPPLLTEQNFLNFMQFLGKSGKFVCWRPYPSGLAPPPMGNLGSAPDKDRIHLILRRYKLKFLRFMVQEMKQECIPVGYVPPAYYLTGGLHDRDLPRIENPPDRDPPGQRHPRTEIPLDRDPLDRDLTGQRPPMNRNITLPQLRCGR